MTSQGCKGLLPRQQSNHEIVVITALVAVIHRSASGVPMRVQSARFEYRQCKSMDCRNKSGNDKFEVMPQTKRPEFPPAFAIQFELLRTPAR
jgi:hypothetical protein